VATSLPSLAALAAALIASQPLTAQESDGSSAVFALMDRNEWCAGGSVYLDVGTGSYLLYPVPVAPECFDRTTRSPVQHGKIGGADLLTVEAALREARRAGLTDRARCAGMIALPPMAGSEVLVITESRYSERTPENKFCWSDEAKALHNELFRIFGR
jgi:hypothetical protein